MASGFPQWTRVEFYAQFVGRQEVTGAAHVCSPHENAPITKEPLAASKFPALWDTIGTLGPSSVIDSYFRCTTATRWSAAPETRMASRLPSPDRCAGHGRDIRAMIR